MTKSTGAVGKVVTKGTGAVGKVVTKGTKQIGKTLIAISDSPDKRAIENLQSLQQEAAIEARQEQEQIAMNIGSMGFDSG